VWIKVRAVVVTLILTVGGLHVAAGQALAQWPCTYQPQTPVMQDGTHIFGGAKWTCDLASNIASEIHVEIWREGERVKHEIFGQKGAHSGVYSTGVPCTPGFHWYSVRTYGWDGSDPVAYVAQQSREIPWECGNADLSAK
jgi:hypothetical protein